ncbi:general substrate transporter [Panaeolus papilionaceus]|nr:general substrate transporter [Panaeolus papilionaceus]
MSSLTKYGWTVAIWGSLNAFQYGYHISCLNQIQRNLVTELRISDWSFSVLTSIFTIGGLVGSLLADFVMNSRGRKGTHRFCTYFLGSGALIMAVGPSLPYLLVGRFLTGVGSGLAMCVTPIYLADIAPPAMRHSLGIFTQLATVFGIMFTQLAGLNFAYPSVWRLVFVLSAILSLVQFLSSPAIVESPAWLKSQNQLHEYTAAAKRLWKSPSGTSSHAPLLEDDPESRDPSPQPRISISQIFTSKEMRRPLTIVCLAMFSQQISGINAVLYYSNDILQKTVPTSGHWVSFGITVINVFMTFPPIILIEKMGRRSLLATSAFGSTVALLLLGYGLDVGAPTISSIAIIGFVMSFAVGMGPVPFVLIPEVSPPHAVSTLSSVALSLNWIVNFIVGLAFLPLRDLLSKGDEDKQGRIFYVFVFTFSLSIISLFRAWKS